MKYIGYIPMTTIIWNKSQIGSRTAWGSFKSPSCPSFPTPFEYILVFAKDNKKLQWKGETDLTKRIYRLELSAMDICPRNKAEENRTSRYVP